MPDSKCVLVAIENEESGRELLQFITDHKWSDETEFLLIYVMQLAQAQDDSELALSQFVRKSQEYGRDLLQRLSSDLHSKTNHRVDHKLVEGVAWEELEYAIAKWKADLVIMGSHGRGPMFRWFMGSVSDTVLSGVNCPAIILRPARDGAKSSPAQSTTPHRTGEKAYKSVVVAVEDFAQSKAVVDLIVNHHWVDNASFDVVHVIDEKTIQDTGYGASESARPNAFAQGKSLVHSVRERLQGHLPSCKFEEHVYIGCPSDTLLEEVLTEHADLIVVGSHGRSGIVRWLFGSVSTPVLEKAPCTVLVAKPGKKSGSRKAQGP